MSKFDITLVCVAVLFVLASVLTLVLPLLL